MLTICSKSHCRNSDDLYQNPALAVLTICPTDVILESFILLGGGPGRRREDLGEGLARPTQYLARTQNQALSWGEADLGLIGRVHFGVIFPPFFCDFLDPLLGTPKVVPFSRIVL